MTSDDTQTDPAPIIADLLASTLSPRDREGKMGTWADARAPYIWERRGLEYLHARILAGDCPPINAWTRKLVDEGYPAAKAGERHGHYWKPGDRTE